MDENKINEAIGALEDTLIDLAVRGGVAKVSVNGKQVEYRSTDDVLTAIRNLENMVKDSATTRPKDLVITT